MTARSNYGYVAYIDEAGDFGLRKVAPIDERGASEWLMVAGVVVRAANEARVPEWLRSIRLAAKNTQSGFLHYRTLSDRQKVVVCTEMAKLDLRIFIAISNKQNIRRYNNERAATISQTRAWLYWWMCRLLLERITDFCERRNNLEGTPDHKVRIEMSRRKDLHYTEFSDYLARLWTQDHPFLPKRTLRWSVVDLKQIHAFDHRTRAGLQLADVAASAFYQSVNRDGEAQCNPEHAKLLQPRVWIGPDGTWFDWGLKVFPFPLKFPTLGERQKEIFKCYGYPDDKWGLPGANHMPASSLPSKGRASDKVP